MMKEEPLGELSEQQLEGMMDFVLKDSLRLQLQMCNNRTMVGCVFDCAFFGFVSKFFVINQIAFNYLERYRRTKPDVVNKDLFLNVSPIFFVIAATVLAGRC